MQYEIIYIFQHTCAFFFSFPFFYSHPLSLPCFLNATLQVLCNIAACLQYLSVRVSEGKTPQSLPGEVFALTPERLFRQEQSWKSTTIFLQHIKTTTASYSDVYCT